MRGEPAAELFLKGVREPVAGHHPYAPTPAAGVDGNLGGNLIFAHEAVFIEDADGEVDLLRVWLRGCFELLPGLSDG
jgi:hypothetical protein